MGSALELYRLLGLRTVNAVIVDLGLPDLDGVEITRFLRQQTGIGVIGITAAPSLEARLRFFESGADLFFAKPLDVRELAMAARGLILRLRAAGASHREPDPVRNVSVGASARAPRPPEPETKPPEWIIDERSWTVHAPNGGSAHLSAKEIRLAVTLCRSAGNAVTRDVLRGLLGYSDTLDGDRSLEALVRRIRAKLKSIDGEAMPIQTVHGSGYLFSAPVRLR